MQLSNFAATIYVSSKTICIMYNYLFFELLIVLLCTNDLKEPIEKLE